MTSDMPFSPPSHQQCVGFVRLALPASAVLTVEEDVTVVSKKCSTSLQKTDGCADQKRVTEHNNPPVHRLHLTLLCCNHRSFLYEAIVGQNGSNLCLLHALGRLVGRSLPRE